jgi:alkylation response protein AidB-like acyl-CoA dehydrogenase
VSLVDEATLGAPLCVDGRARHGRGAASLALPESNGGLAMGVAGRELRAEPTLDGSGTVEFEVEAWSPLEPVAAEACWRAWNAATLAYFAGLATRSLELAVEHARAREQFGAPLAAIPAVQSRLADAALATDALTLLAWAAASNGGGVQEGELRWAGTAACEVTASAHQVYGALGFALESGLHVYYRRARAVQAWAVAVCDSLRSH